MRSHSFKFLILGLVFLAGAHARAADLTSFGVGSDGETWSGTLWNDLKSPITTDARYTLIGGSSLTLLLVGMEDQVDTPLQSAMTSAKPMGKSSHYGDLGGMGVPNALYFLGMWAFGHDYQAGLMARTTLSAGIAVTAMKYAFREPRPNHNGHREAFPSGHTTVAFSFASVVGCEHSLAWGAAAYAMGGFIGLSRINDNEHTLHQVVAGAVLGTSYGLGICWRDRARGVTAASNDDSLSSRLTWAVLPLDDDGFGLRTQLLF